MYKSQFLAKLKGLGIDRIRLYNITGTLDLRVLEENLWKHNDADIENV